MFSSPPTTPLDPSLVPPTASSETVTASSLETASPPISGVAAAPAEPLINQPDFSPPSQPPFAGPPVREMLRPSKKSWLGVALVILALAAGTFYIMNRPRTNVPVNNQASTGSGPNQLADISEESVTFGIDTKIANGKTFTATGPVIIQNAADSLTAFKIQNAAGANLLVADTQNGRVGIGATPTGNAALQVGGDISATGSVSSGGGATELSNSGLIINSVLVCTASGCKPQGLAFTGDAATLGGHGASYYANVSNLSAGTLSDSLLSGNIARLNTDQTFSGINSFTAAGNTFVGDGSGLSALNAGNITSGTVNDNRLSTNVALLDANNIFTGNNIFKSATNATNAFQIQDAAGNDNLLIADTVNTRIGIGVATPNYTLDVNGDVNVSAGHTFRIDGTDVCSGGLCNPASGSSYYVNNTTTQQADANFNIRSADATDVGGIIQGASGQTADLFEGKDSTGSTVYALDPQGNVNITGNYEINGSTLCTAGGCTAASGSGNYIQNGISLQSDANFNIESVSASNVVGILKGKSGQTADLLELKDGSGAVVTSIGNQGQALFKDSSAGSHTFFQIQNASAQPLLTADTITGQILLPDATVSSSAILIGGDANLYRSANSTLKTDGNLVVAGNLTGNGTAMFKNTADSANAFQIQNASGANIFNVNTSNSRVSFAAATSSATGVYFGAGDELYGVGGSLKTLSSLWATGNANLFQTATNSTTALQIQNANGLNLLTADTTNFKVSTTQLQATSTVGSASGTASAQLSWNLLSSTGLTMSGNEITDATRRTNTQGDGVTPPDSSTGVWEATTNMFSDPSFESTGNDTSTAKFGTQSLSASVASDNNWHNLYQTNVNVSPSTIYTISEWTKTSAAITVGFSIDWYTGTNGTGSVINTCGGNQWTSSTDWQRFSGGCTSPSNAASGKVFFRNIQNTGSSVTAWLDGIQMEQKAYATPFTTSSRSAARIRAPSAAIGSSTTGWVAMRFRTDVASTDIGNFLNGEAHLFDWEDGSGHGITAYFNNTNGLAITRTHDTGSNAAVTVGPFSKGTVFTLVFYWTGSAVDVSVNGGNFVNTNQTPAAAFGAMNSLFDIGSVANARWADGDFLWFVGGTGTLSNPDAATLNSYGNTDPALSSLTTMNSGAAVPTMVWNGSTSTYSSSTGTVVQSALTLDDASLYRGSANTLQTNSNFLLQSSINSTTAFQVQDSNSSTVLDVDTANGRVGIGTSTPGQKLDVNGSIRIAGGNFLSFGPSDSLKIQDAGSNLMDFYTNGVLQASLDSSGNFTLDGNGLLVMGIKTSDPTCKNGATYYNSTSNTFRGCANGSWNDFSMAGTPAGTIQAYAGLTAPMGYLVADGSAVSRTTYAALFAVIGTTYGVGDGSTTFNLPDLRGRTAVGLNPAEVGRTDVTALGNNEGVVVGSRTPYHKGSASAVSTSTSNSTSTVTSPVSGNAVVYNGAGSGFQGGSGGNNWPTSSFGVNTVTTTTTNTTVTVGPQTNVPTDTGAYLTLNYIIKY